MLDETNIECPYCGEAFSILVDTSGGSQQYFEDCQVCCRPILIHTQVNTSHELAHIEVHRDDD